MQTKRRDYLYRQWVEGKINLIAAARRMGYKKASLTKGVMKVRNLLNEMGIAVM